MTRMGWMQRTTSEGLISHSSPTQQAGGNEPRLPGLFHSWPFWGKRVAILETTTSLPSLCPRRWRGSLCRDFKRGFCTVGWTQTGLPTLKKESPTFSALLTAEGCFCYLLFPVSIKLSTQVVFILSPLSLLPFFSFSFLHLVWKSRFKEQKPKVLPYVCRCLASRRHHGLLFVSFGKADVLGQLQLSIRAWLVGHLLKTQGKASSSYICRGGTRPQSHGNKMSFKVKKKKKVKWEWLSFFIAAVPPFLCCDTLTWRLLILRHWIAAPCTARSGTEHNLRSDHQRLFFLTVPPPPPHRCRTGMFTHAAGFNLMLS